MNRTNYHFPTKFNRTFLRTKNIIQFLLSNIVIIFSLFQISTFAQEIDPIKLSWLGGKAPTLSTGVSWGVPLPEGKIDPSSSYVLKTDQGQKLPIQSWPLAYWPDGSLKWVGLSTVVDGNARTSFELETRKGISTDLLKSQIDVTETDDIIVVNTGIMQFEIPKQGKQLISSIKMDGKEISSGGKLVCILQNGPSQEVGTQPSKEKFIGTIENVIVEQKGTVRTVVKLKGQHVSESGSRSWLPFIVRLYFYAGQESVRMMHTIIYDGDQEKDFIRGVGLVFDVPMDEQLYNRHIRFSGENGGLWDEPCQPLNGRIPLIDNGIDLYTKQLTGERIAERKSFSEKQQFLIDHWPIWNDFKLEQSNADGFRVLKRTNNLSTWIDAGYGKRSDGMAFVGDVSGGLALCVKDFWQSFPSSLEINNVKTNTAQIKAWFWSPEASPMDMRHYDTLAWGHGLTASYEDVQPGFSTPMGVGRTSEIMLFASNKVPSYETLNKIVQQGNHPALLTAAPEYIHSIPVFGKWSLPDRSTKSKIWIEDQLDNAFEYYQGEVEQRHWYGFWNFGDVMHGYDQQRNTWKYDMGGFAWDNTELMPNMWLWYSYLRSGREEIFRMAEAMTRHNGEVDVYHLGKFEGFGSRHNVIHWGGGAKEVRISQAALGRFYYYLTTDERTGDLMHASVEASNNAIGKYDPLRLILKNNKYPTHARVGPDWFALVGNWMTEWERTGDIKYKDRILTGVDSFSEMPYGFFSGKNGAFGYDPKTYKLFQLSSNAIGYSHLSVLMGGPEIAYELTHLLNNDKWNKLWYQFCRLYAAPKEIVENEFGKAVELGNPGPWYARLPAYYANLNSDKNYAARAWDDFLNVGDRRYHTDFNMKKNEGIQSLQPVFEVKGVSTNNTAQWCLNAIQLLELIGDQLPEENSKVEVEK